MARLTHRSSAAVRDRVGVPARGEIRSRQREPPITPGLVTGRQIRPERRSVTRGFGRLGLQLTLAFVSVAVAAVAGALTIDSQNEVSMIGQWLDRHTPFLPLMS
jgi:hypothetical protein